MCIKMDLIVTSFVICIASSHLSNSLVYGIPNIYDVRQFGAAGDGRVDDSKAFLKAWGVLCRVGGTPTLVVPQGKFLLKPLEFKGPCKSRSVHLKIMGNIVAPNIISAWGECNNAKWIAFSNIDNLIIDGNGFINGQGSIWWNPTGILATQECMKPTALHFHNCNNLQISGVTTQNPPKNHISISSCNVVTISHININAPEDSPNTDGIDISSSTQVNIHDSIIATGDDCIAINGGSSNINITSIACGPGHGISVGSLGKNGVYDTVEDVRVRGCTFTKTQNGARIKTWRGGLGFARRISYEDITLVGAKHPIIIDQNYCNGRPCDPNLKSSKVQISDVTFSGFRGSSPSKLAIALTCSNVVGCSNVVMDHVNITSVDPSVVLTASCENVTGRSSFTFPQVPCLRNQ